MDLTGDLMSTHSVNIVTIEQVLPHANADRLEIVPVNGWQAVVKKGQFAPGDHAIYIEPDYTIPTAREEFSFLAKDGRDRHRLKAVRFRGALSFGLLIPVPSELADRAVGDNVMADLGIERYEPPVKLAGSDELPADLHPKIYSPKFDVESFKRYPAIFELGEPVIITEKIHGANARYLFADGVFYMGSRSQWLKPDVNHPWKRAADSNPQILSWCERHPSVVLYGEIYGAVQSLKYGCAPGEIRFAAFAVLAAGHWLDTGELLAERPQDLPTVPVVYRGPFDPAIFELAERDSTVPGVGAGHMREGIVIVPARERRHDELGRVALKHISNRYWESAD
jgi:RNA ligase (TIGR02306 family)